MVIGGGLERKCRARAPPGRGKSLGVYIEAGAADLQQNVLLACNGYARGDLRRFPGCGKVSRLRYAGPS